MPTPASRSGTSLRSKLLLPLLSCGLVVLLGSAWAVKQVAEHLLDGKLRERGELIAHMVNYAAECLPRTGELQRIVSAIGAEPDINLIVVVGGNPSVVLATTRHAWLGQPLESLPWHNVREDLSRTLTERASSHRIHSDSENYDFTAPLLLSQSHLAHTTLSDGAVMIHLDSRSMTAEAHRIASKFVAAFLMTLTLLAAIAILLVRHHVLVPLEAIQRMARTFPKIPVDVHVATSRDDEIGELARALSRSLERTSAALRDLENQKYALDQHAIVAVTDTRGRITYVNERFCAISQYSREELLGRNHRLVNSGHHPREFFAEMWATISAGRVWHGEIRNRTRGGTHYWVETTIVPLTGPDGAVAQYISIRTDITDRKVAEESLQLSNQQLELATAQATELAEQAKAASSAKGDFLASMSHEIRTPMNGIIGFADLLLKSELPETQREYAATIKNSSHALLAILNDILDFSKIEAGKLDLELLPFNPAECVHEVVALLCTQAASKGISLDIDLPTQPVDRVLADATRYRQILFNLVGNALKFTRQGGVRIRLGSTRSLPSRPVTDAPDLQVDDPSSPPAQSPPEGNRPWMLVEVVDSGIGIPPEKHRLLFSKFSQADSSTTRRFGGTGLGLSICRQLVELMGGHIGFQSEPGRGSTFWFAVPTTDAPAAPPVAPPPPTALEWPGVSRQLAPAAPEPSTPPIHSRKVLVAEDTLVNQFLACEMLESLGYTARIANDGREAVTLFQSEDFDLILMDCHMPELDGFDATAAIRHLETQRPRRTPIIALTASAMAEDREKCLASGMDDYLTKPFSFEKLEETVRRWMPASIPGAVHSEAAGSPSVS